MPETRGLVSFIKPEIVFLLIGLLLGLVIIPLSPPGLGYDEHTHLARIDQILHGGLFSTVTGLADNYEVTDEASRKNAELYGGLVDASLYDTASSSILNIQGSHYFYYFPAWDDMISGSNTSYGQAGRDVRVFSNTAVNIPYVYLPYFPGMLIGRLAGLSIYWLVAMTRMSGFLFFLSIGFASIRNIPFGKWSLAAFLLLPAVFADILFVTADLAANTLSLLLLTLFLRFVYTDQPDGLGLAVFGVATILLPTAKLTYAPLLLLPVLLPMLNPSMRRRGILVFLACCCTAALAILLVWFSAIRGINTGAMWREGVNPSQQLALLLKDPLHHAKTVAFSTLAVDALQIDSFGVISSALGNITYYHHGFWIPPMLLIASVFITDPREAFPVSHRTKRVVAAAFLLIFAICTALIFTALFLSFTPVGQLRIDGVQPRYYIPLAPLLITSLLMLLKSIPAEADSQSVREQTTGLETARVVFFLATALLLEINFLVLFRCCVYQ